MTSDDLQERVGAYCARYEVVASPAGLPPFPAGHRESPRHREWLALYKLHSRLGRRALGQCERCSSPAVEGGVFCEKHRSAAPGGRPVEDHRRLLAAQRARCPICERRLDVNTAVLDSAGSDPRAARALLHPTCARLVETARSLSPEALERLRVYVWPRS